MFSGSCHQVLYIAGMTFSIGLLRAPFPAFGRRKGSLDWIVVRLGGYDKRVSAGEHAFLCVTAVCCGVGNTVIVPA